MGHAKHLTHGSVAEFLILHLLQSAAREPLYQMQEWAEQFGVQRIYGCPASAFNDDRIGRALDAVYTPRLRRAAFLLWPGADGLPTPLDRFLAIRDWVERKG